MRYLFYYTLFFTLIFAQNDFNWQTDGVPIRQGLHIEWQRTGDSGPDGSIIFAWSDCRNNGVRDIIAQKVDVNGNNLWGDDNGVVVVNASGRQEDPQLVTDGAGGTYIIWMDYRDETDAEGDIYAQHVKSDGSLEWGIEGLALVDQPGQQFSPNICSDGQGGAYVIWKDNEASSYGDIVATHLSSGGVIAPGQGVPIITYSSYRSNPSLNTGGSGAAVLVWSDNRNTDEDLYSQRISVNGNTINTEWEDGGKLVCDAFGDQTKPRVDQYDGDETIITWEDCRINYGDEDNLVCKADLYYQILNGDGNEQLTVNGAPACSGDWEIILPRVKAENSVAYIVWEDRRNVAGFSDIYAQKIDLDGSTAWVENGLEITTSEGSQTEIRLTTDGSGGAYFVWEDHRDHDDSGIDIYAQHVNFNDEITLEENGELICDAENKQFGPLVRNDGNGGAIIVWGDQRYGGSFGLFVQRLQTSGISFSVNGRESFFGIGTDDSNEPYKHGSVYLENDQSLIYWQDNRWGRSKIYGTLISSTFNGSGGDYFTNPAINGQQLSELEYPQEDPKAILAGNKIFLSFKKPPVEESSDENLYVQLLNMDLSSNGNAVALAETAASIHGFDMVYGEDGYIYYAYSEDDNISIKKISNNVEVEWTVSAITNPAGLTDYNIKSVYPYPNSGCVIIYESQSFLDGSHIYALAVDESGQAQSAVLVSNLSANQYYENSALTEDGVFVSFTENSSGDYDVYGQHVLFDGELDFVPSGVVIASGPGNQQSSSVAYNDEQNEIFVCYESPDGSETDIRCNEIDLNIPIVDGGIVIAAYDNNQNAPFVYWSGHSFMISWEDSRMSSEEDIFFQEYKNGDILLSSGGTVLSSFDKKQEHTINVKYSDTDNAYIIVFEDHRSTGKAQITNLWAQSYTSRRCPAAIGDLNGDGLWNVQDIVILANCVLAPNCNTNCLDEETGEGNECYGCAGLISDDAGWNILDIVILANCILAGEDCGGRVDDATLSRLIMKDNMVSIEADGFIGGVQMTIQHGDDFRVKMTERALIADYLTTGNETRLLIVTPETDELFSYSGDFEITELIVANSHAEVSASLPLVDRFSLSQAYPNPFNPTTTMTLIMPVAGAMKVEIYNLLGQSITILTRGYKDAGSYNLIWDATDAASGMYFVKAQAEEFSTTQKLMLIK